jgi:hypothetical protein
MAGTEITINRAPVLTLWAAVVAHRLGHDWQAALTLGKALAGLNAQSKGRRLGIYGAKGAEEPGSEKKEPPGARELPGAPLLGRLIPVAKTPAGLRAAADGKPMDPDGVKRYLELKFGADLAPAREAMEALAKSYPPKQLDTQAFALYERFRPQVPDGKKGWGAKGVLDLKRIRSLAKKGGAST